MYIIVESPQDWLILGKTIEIWSNFNINVIKTESSWWYTTRNHLAGVKGGVETRLLISANSLIILLSLKKKKTSIKQGEIVAFLRKIKCNKSE